MVMGSPAGKTLRTRRRASPALQLLLCVMLAAASRPAMSDNAVIYLPSDPNAEWFLKVGNTPWHHAAIHGAMTTLAMAQIETTRSLCEPMFATDLAASLGFVLLTWEPVDYRPHIALLEERYTEMLWKRLLRPGAGLDDAQREEVRRGFWGQFGEGVLDTFARGEAVMQAIVVDIDKDGMTETLYRLPILEPVTLAEGNGKEPVPGTEWTLRICRGSLHETPIYGGVLAPEEEEERDAYGERLTYLFTAVQSLVLVKFEGRLHVFSSSTGSGGALFDMVRRGDVVVAPNLWSGFFTPKTYMPDDTPIVVWPSE